MSDLPTPKKYKAQYYLSKQYHLLATQYMKYWQNSNRTGKMWEKGQYFLTGTSNQQTPCTQFNISKYWAIDDCLEDKKEDY